MTEDNRNVKLEQTPDNGRRAFIKKAGYVAPALVVLGVAGHSSPTHAQLGGSGPGPLPDSSADPMLEDLEQLEKSKD